MRLHGLGMFWLYSNNKKCSTSFCQVVGVSQNSGQTTFVHIIVEVTIFICETPPHRNIAVARFCLERFLKSCLAMVARKQLQWYHSTMPVACWWAVAEGRWPQTLFAHLQSLHTSFAPSILKSFKSLRWTKSWHENSNIWVLFHRSLLRTRV